MDNTIVFENAERSLAKEMLTASPEFTIEDVRTFADIGAVRLDDARQVVAKMESVPFSMDRAMKDDVIQKKALIMIAKEKDDPDYKLLLELYQKIEETYASLETKYGDEARLNRQTLIGKLMDRFRGSQVYQKLAGKVSTFQ